MKNKKENKQDIISLSLGYFGIIFMTISLAISVSAIYSGETFEYNLTEFTSITNHSILGNTSFINYSIQNFTIIGKIPEDYDSGVFTISIWGFKEGEEVVVKKSGGGSSCLTNYKCSEWSNCLNGVQTRTCEKEKSYCYAKPVNLTQSCNIQTPTNESQTNETPETEESNDSKNSSSKKDVFIIVLLISLPTAAVIYFLIKFLKKK